MKTRICFMFLVLLVLWFALFQSFLLIFKYSNDAVAITQPAETKIHNFDTRPLLKQNDSPLVVNVEDKRMNISLAIGIPTVLRDDAAHYLIKTVNTILDDIPRFPGPNPVKKIVLLNAEDDEEDQARLIQLVERAFPEQVASGLIEIIHPPDSYYDKLSNPCTLARNYNDTLARVLWRSKLVLDGAYLMEYVKNMPYDYYLHLEDDTPASKQKWLQEMFAWTESWANNDTWGALKFSLGRPTKKRPNWDGMELPRKQFGGMIALLMKMNTVGGLAEHLIEHFDRGPIDWEFGDYMLQLDKHVYGHNPSLFVHVGKLSTSKHVVEHEKKKKKNIKDTVLTWETCKNKPS